MAYGDLKVRNLIWNTGSGDNTVVLSTLATQSYVTTNFAPKSAPTFAGTINGVDLVLSGNLTVSGTQTIINTNVLQVEDKHIEIGKVSSPSDTTADGGGIILKASSDRTFVWINSTDAWTSSEHIQVASGKTFIGDGSTLTALNATNLASGTVPTARLGTGTAGSSNYLRGDGSWQTIDLSAKANLSGATFTGDISLGDNNITNVGEISVDKVKPDNGTHWVANMGTDKNIMFSGNIGEIGNVTGFQSVNDAQNANTAFGIRATDIRLATGSAERFRVGSSGQLGIGGATYGTSGQVLTSGGSSAAPSWAAVPPAGNTVDLVADGAIAAGKPVIIKSNGKVAQIQIASFVQDGVVRNASSEQTFGSTGSNKLEGNTRKNCVAYNPDSDTTFVISHVQSIDRMVGQLFSTPSTGTDAQKAAITRHQITEITVEGAGEDKGFFCVCNLSGKRFFIVYEKYNVLKCRVITVGLDNDDFTMGTENNLITSSSVKYKWFSAVETATDRVVIMCTSETNNGVFNDEHFGLICGDISNSGNSWTYRSNIELDNNNSGQGSKGGRLDYDSTNGVIAVSWSTNNVVKMRALKVASGTGAAFTSGTAIQLATSTLRNTIKYHSNSGSWITFWCNTSQANYVQAHTVNSSTLAITSGTAVHLSSWAGGLRGVDIEVTNEHKIILAWLRSSDDITTKMYTISGTTITATSGSAVNVCSSITDFETFGMVYQGHNSIVSFYGHRSSNNGIFGGSGLTVSNATNLASANQNFLGFAENAISDGNTGTIKLQGNVVGNQSGLTPATWYAVQDDGTLSSGGSSSSAGGLAVASDKLRIKEVPKS